MGGSIMRAMTSPTPSVPTTDQNASANMSANASANHRDKAKQDVRVFEKHWAGGYYEGDPMDPMASSTYGVLGYMSVLHATYLRCIRPYVTKNSTVLEIGPGRGAWSRTMTHAKELWCLDVMSAEHNGFWEYVGKQHDRERGGAGEGGSTKYVQVSDFSLSSVPDRHFDFFFSFGVFCHIPFAGLTEYMTNLRRKLKPGADAFLMVADYDQYNRAWDNLDQLGAQRPVLEMAKKSRPKWRRFMPGLWWQGERERQNRTPRKDPRNDGDPAHGVWYHAGKGRTCELLRLLGYTVMDEDVGVLPRDPVIWFRA